jgi:predicted dehydrogenase
MEHMQVAVIGLGKMGILHSCILKRIPNVEVVALCEKSGMIRRFLKKIFTDTRIVDDVEKLADLGLDAVYITTPIPSHFSIAKAICEQKIARNLFVEKTLATSYSEARELCNLAGRLGGVNMVGYLRRFYVTFRKAKELLSQSTVGQLSSFEAYAYSADFREVKQDPAAYTSTGDVLRDLGCHALDVALWFFGELQISSANAKSSSASWPDDYVSFRVKGFNALEGGFSASRCMDGYRMPEVGLSIIGSKGSLIVNDDKVELSLTGGRSFVWYRHDLSDHVPFWLGLPEYYREDLHFAESVSEGHIAEPSFYDASKVDEIISQLEENAGKSYE